MAEDTKPNYQASCVQLCRAGYRRVWSAEGTRRVSETEETERLRKTPSWSPSEENSTSCVCASHCSPSPSARRVTKTSCELLLQTPRPNNEKGRRVWYSTGRGREGDKGVTHTHMHYANRSADTGVHEDTHTRPDGTRTHAVRAQMAA